MKSGSVFYESGKVPCCRDRVECRLVTLAFYTVVSCRTLAAYPCDKQARTVNGLILSFRLVRVERQRLLGQRELFPDGGVQRFVARRSFQLGDAPTPRELLT